MTDRDALLEGLDPRTRKRFKRVKQRSQVRTSTPHVSHDEFLNMLLDVWELDERYHEQRYRRDSDPDTTEATA